MILIIFTDIFIFSIFESKILSAEQRLRTIFPEKTIKLLQKQTFPGAKILINKLKA